MDAMGLDPFADHSDATESVAPGKEQHRGGSAASTRSSNSNKKGHRDQGCQGRRLRTDGEDCIRSRRPAMPGGEDDSVQTGDAHQRPRRCTGGHRKGERRDWQEGSSADRPTGSGAIAITTEERDGATSDKVFCVATCRRPEEATGNHRAASSKSEVFRRFLWGSSRPGASAGAGAGASDELLSCDVSSVGISSRGDVASTSVVTQGRSLAEETTADHSESTKKMTNERFATKYGGKRQPDEKRGEGGTATDGYDALYHLSARAVGTGTLTSSCLCSFLKPLIVLS